MVIPYKEIICAEEKLHLLPHKALYWVAAKTLVLADLHLGKTAYFRKSGIPIPNTVMQDDLKRLHTTLQIYSIKKMIVVGDMFHHNYNADIEYFKQWRQQYPQLIIELVPGNHDKLLKMDYAALNIVVKKEKYFLAPFVFEHEHTENDTNYFTICGHIHPGYKMEGKAKQSLRLPCFLKSSNCLILPAFSNFTGLSTRYFTTENNQYFVIGNGKIHTLQ
ncbi:MAG: ligase-associated DNA damage response endonuclease PdeM [Niabella sp.]